MSKNLNFVFFLRVLNKRWDNFKEKLHQRRFCQNSPWVVRPRHVTVFETFPEESGGCNEFEEEWKLLKKNSHKFYNNNNIGLLLNMTVVNSSTLVTRQWQCQWFGDQRLLLLSTCTMLYYDKEHKLCSLTNTFGCINIQELCEIRNGRFQ